MPISLFLSLCVTHVLLCSIIFVNLIDFQLSKSLALNSKQTIVLVNAIQLACRFFSCHYSKTSKSNHVTDWAPYSVAVNSNKLYASYVRAVNITTYELYENRVSDKRLVSSLIVVFF